MSEAPESLEPLSEEAKALIQELRTNVEPPVGAEARILEQVQGSAGAGGGSLGWVVGAAAVTAVIAAVIVFGKNPEPEPVEPQPTPVVDAPESAEHPEPAPKLAEPEGEPASEPEVEVEPEPAKPAARNRATPSKPSSGDAFERELELLDKAKKASAAGRQDEAIRLLKKHAKQFKRGVLAAERDAALVVAYCKRGDTRGAKAAADRFWRRHPGSHLGERVRRSCAGPAPEEK